MWYLYILGYPKIYSDAPAVSKLSKCITPSSGSPKLKPFTVKIPSENNVISENLLGDINDSTPATSTQSTSYQSNRI